MILIRH